MKADSGLVCPRRIMRLLIVRFHTHREAGKKRSAHSSGRSNLPHEIFSWELSLSHPARNHSTVAVDHRCPLNLGPVGIIAATGDKFPMLNLIYTSGFKKSN